MEEHIAMRDQRWPECAIKHWADHCAACLRSEPLLSAPRSPDGLICGMGHWAVDTDTDISRSRDGHRGRHQTVASRPSPGPLVIMDLRVNRDVLLTWPRELTHQDYLHRQLSSMQRAGQLCDLHLVCGASGGWRTLSCHKIVLASHSVFLRLVVLTGNMSVLNI